MSNSRIQSFERAIENAIDEINSEMFDAVGDALRSISAITCFPEGADLDTARDWLRRGNRAEAMVHIERALGSDFIGTLT